MTEKRVSIETDHPRLSISRQCKLIGLNRSCWYAWKNRQGCSRVDEYNLALMRLIDEEYTRHPFYGSRKLTVWLKSQGYWVNRKRIRRLMKMMGLVSVAPKPNTSKPAPEHNVYPYLLRNPDINRPNQVWCADITYIRFRHGFVYLMAVMDWYSRQVLSWELSISMEDDFCVSALERALRLYGKPEIFNTDQGAQFTGKAFTKTLQQAKVKISMDGKGRAMDNIFIERLWRSVKYEEIYLNEYESVYELRQALKRYFQFYNHERPHQSLGDRSPSEVYNLEMPIAA
jgi:putative transposase